MVKTEKQSREIQVRRADAGKPGIAKAVRRFGRKIVDDDKRRDFFNSLPRVLRESAQ